MKSNFCRRGDILSKHWQIWQCPFSFIYEHIGKREEREIHLNIYCVLSTLKPHHLIFFLTLNLWDKYYFCLTNKQLLMLQKRRYTLLIYIINGRTRDMIWTLAIVILDLFSHVEESVSWSLPSSGPQGIDMGVFLLLVQKHSQILTKAGNLSAAFQLEAGVIIAAFQLETGVIIAVIHWVSSALGIAPSVLLFKYVISLLQMKQLRLLAPSW